MVFPFFKFSFYTSQVKYFCLFLLLAMTSIAKAVDKSFHPAGTEGFWSEPANWIPAGVPDSSDKVTIPQGYLCRMNLSLSRTGDLLVEPNARLQVIVAFEQIYPGKIEVQNQGIFDVSDGVFRFSAGVDFSGTMLVNQFTSLNFNNCGNSTAMPVLSSSSIGSLNISGNSQISLNANLGILGSLNIEPGSSLLVKQWMLACPSYSAGIILSEESGLEILGGGNISLPSLSLRSLKLSNEGNASFAGEISLRKSFELGPLSSIVNLPESKGGLKFVGSEEISELILGKSAELRDLKIDKSAGKLILAGSGNLGISGTLEVVSGMLDLNAHTLTLLSIEGKSAHLAPLGGSITSAENLVFQRQVGNSNGGWYLMGPTSQNRNFSDWNDDFETKGPFPGAGQSAAANENSIYSFEGTGNPSGNSPGEVNGWRIPTEDKLEPGKGFRVYLNPNFFAGNKTIDHQGPPVSGNFDFNLKFDPNGFEGGGWNLLSNPYPSSIDWNSGSWQKQNIAGTIYTLNGSTGQYAAFNFADDAPGLIAGTNGATGIIGGGQGFFVRATAGSPALKMGEAVKSEFDPAFQKVSVGESSLMKIKLIDAAGNTDENIVRFHPEGALTFDPRHDAWKMPANKAGISMKTSDGVDVCINTIPKFPADETRIPLTAKAGAGNCKFQFSGLDDLAAEMYIFLLDNYSGNLSQIQNGSVYEFEVSQSSGSQAEGRFELIFSENRNLPEKLGNASPGISVVSEEGGRILIRANNIVSGKGRISIHDMNGKELFLEEISGRLIAGKEIMLGIPAGVYNLRWEQEDTVLTARFYFKGKD